MFCSKCGAVVGAQQTFCARCGHSITRILKQGDNGELARFERTIRRLSRYWYLFAGLSVVLGVMGLFAVQTGLSMQAGPWEPWPHPYIWNWTLAGGVGWMLFLLRVGFAAAAGWGLSRETDWSRPVALIAAGIAFLEFPIGVVLAVYTFSVLLGRHHAELYARLESMHRTLVAR